ncbi:ATP-binding cassette domain-containing protein [Mycetocola tolaasinivorans]|uniref:ATP-binding cassette domain-containing protein n=1 Tax=Mycetocola tolaasinivorans TaxID=76635 RepID=A0A3L7A6T7_9MICO|nr:ATP-binding cassette domain-containing protein [Mycetocola tolaasinivorans]
MTASAVSIRDWGWRHASRLAWALEHVTLEIAAGERVLILGPSGAGKSTLLHALAGVLGGADEGDAQGVLTVDGEDPAHRRGRSGLLLQDPDSQMILARVGDDVAFGCENLGVPRDEIWARVGEALEAVGLDVPLDRSTQALSGGQKQRLALAGVLAMHPGLLLLDEPTANLDPVGVAEVRDAVGRVLDKTGATLVVIEHRVDTWLPLVDRVIVLGTGGAVIADGHPDTVLTERGAELAAAGVWVPGHPPRVALPEPLPAGEALLDTRDLLTARVRGVPVGTPVSTTVRAGEVLAITGANGAGKSTLALTLAGLLRPEGGELTATATLSRGLGAAPIAWKSTQLLQRIGTVFQDPEHQFLATTVRRELEVGPRALGLEPAEIDARVDDVLARLGLAHLERAHPFTLSGGEKRRLSVATALVSRPDILVLDEPTFGQDALTWARLVELIGALRAEGSAIITVSHDAEFVAALADRTLTLTALRPEQSDTEEAA